MNDVRLDGVNGAMYNIRRSAFVIKGLGKSHYPEAILIQKTEIVHRDRVLQNRIIKPARTFWQDTLIDLVIMMTVHPYVDVRRAAQGSLYHLTKRYRKWAPKIFPILLKALASDDIDTVKGALHTLRISSIEHALARQWTWTEQYVLTLFKAYQKFDRVLTPFAFADVAIDS